MSYRDLVEKEMKDATEDMLRRDLRQLYAPHYGEPTKREQGVIDEMFEWWLPRMEIYLALHTEVE